MCIEHIVRTIIADGSNGLRKIRSHNRDERIGLAIVFSKKAFIARNNHISAFNRRNMQDRIIGSRPVIYRIEVTEHGAIETVQSTVGCYPEKAARVDSHIVHAISCQAIHRTVIREIKIADSTER